MRMIPPQQQLVSPFFLGGEVLEVSYPTNTMSYEQRITTMRANNIAMSHATVFHEMMPGHELQGFMETRYRAYRLAFGGTPFLIEGWALYWEMLFWDMGFDRTPEERVGVSKRRCALFVSCSRRHGIVTSPPLGFCDGFATQVTRASNEFMISATLKLQCP